jgi:hypothetical protein
MNKCLIDIEVTSFSPWENGRIIVIGIRNIQTGETKIFSDTSEETLLMEFLRYYNKLQFQQIIGYNVSHDVRYIFSRCLKYNIPAPMLFNSKQTDIMKILKSVKGGYDYNKPGTLDQWSQYLLNRSKMFCNTDIPSLYEAGRIDEIIKYELAQ